MAISASAIVEVGFNDQLTKPAQQAFERFKANATSAFSEFTFVACESFENIRQKLNEPLFLNVQPLGEDFLGINNVKDAVLTVAATLGIFSLDWIRVRKNILKTVSTILRFSGKTLVVLSRALLRFGPHLTTFAAGWAAGTKLGEFTINSKPVNQYVGEAFDFWLSGNISEKLKTSAAGFTQWGTEVLASVQQTVQGIQLWLGDKFGVIVDVLGAKVERVKGFFKGMWNSVVGNSYVPDMIEGIGLWFGKLGGVMVDPTRLATASVGQGFAQMALQAEEQARKTERAMQGMDLLRRGQEGESKHREVEEQMDLLTELENRMRGLAPAMERQFIESLQNMVKTGKFEFKDLFDFAIRQFERMNGEFGRTPPFNLGSPGGGIGGGFPDFAGKALGFLRGFDFGGFFEHGGRVHGNRPIVVGERGPELFVPRSSGTVIPNNQLGLAGGSAPAREPAVPPIVVNQTLNIQTGVAQSVRVEMMNLLPTYEKRIMGAIAQAVQSGGRFSNIIRGR